MGIQSLLQFTKIICYTYVLVMSLFPYPYICFELQSVPILFTNRRSQKTLVEHYVLVHGLFELLPSFFRIPYLKMNFHPYPYFLRIPYQGYGYGKSTDPYTPFGVWVVHKKWSTKSTFFWKSQHSCFDKFGG